MLAAYGAAGAAVWFDLLDPGAEDIRAVEQATGLHVPSREELSEIETSSRLRTVGEALYLSAPLVYRAEATRMAGTTPVGFVGLAEAMIERMADVLEGVGGELHRISRRMFHAEVREVRRLRRADSEDADLRVLLRRIGAAADLAPSIRDGLIGIEQNNVFKVLTVASVIGIPPTLIAGMYGMNFKGMPEYDWAWGYPYGLALILLSAVIPWVWFKRKGWL